MQETDPGAREARVSARVRAAQRRRSAVVEAAAALFDEYGYGATTLQAIADRAGVSVETVGLTGPKRRLLRAAFDMAFAGDSAAFPASGAPAYIALTEELGWEAAVESYCRLLASAVARTAGLWAAFQAAADADRQAALLFEEVREVRRREFHRTAQWLVERGVVSDAQIPALVQEFFLIASHETYLLLRSECGYTAEMFAGFIHARVAALLSTGARPSV